MATASDRIKASGTIKAAIDLANDRYRDGMREGYLRGLNDGMEAARRVMAGESAKEVLEELKSKI